MTANDGPGIIPKKFYRKSVEETREILRIGETATYEAIADGILDPPASLTSRGRGKGWWGGGWQIIPHMRQRVAAAQQQQIAIDNKDGSHHHEVRGQSGRSGDSAPDLPAPEQLID
jgi:hypothetical protein